MVARAGNGSLAYLYAIEKIERLEAENARLEKALDRMTARYIDASNRTTNAEIL